MPKVKISEYSATANSNTDVASINIDEGCAPSGINNAIRAVMGHLKDFQQGTYGDPFNGPVNGTLGATTASTANVTTLTTSSTVTHNGGTANGVAYLNGSKVLTTGSALVFDGTNLGVGVTPSGWSGVKALQFGGGAFALSSSGAGAGDGSSTWNGYYNGTNWIYNYTGGGVSRFRLNESGAAWFIAPSGTAGNTITFTQAMTLNAAGDLGLGTTSPPNTAGYTTLALNNATNGGFLGLLTGGVQKGAVFNAGNNVYIDCNNSAGQLLIRNTSTGATTTIDSSGNLLVGTTSTGYTSSGSTYYSPSVQYWINNHLTGTSSGTRYIGFGIGTGEIGSITQSGTTAVLYNTTSDYRLKNDQQALTGAKDFIMALKPKKWQWWDGSGEGVGFVAHEFMEVAKYSGNGEKDAVDADGKPVYQSIQSSSSEVMANLVSFVQEQQALITTLTARITALEAT